MMHNGGKGDMPNDIVGKKVSEMRVPKHIMVGGESDHDLTHPKRPLSMSDVPDYLSQMNVPERLFIANPNELRGDRAPPAGTINEPLNVEYPTAELISLPGPISLDKVPGPEVPVDVTPITRQDESMTMNSVAIDENPIRELKKMRRQLGRLSTRVYKLEDEIERRKNKETLIWTYLLSFTGFVLFLIFKRKVFRPSL